MDWLGIAGYVIAAILGAGWWLERRGVPGIKRDLADAKREVGNRVK